MKENEKVSKLEQPLNMDFLNADLKKYSNNADTAKAERYKQWLKVMSTDIYIDETARIVGDMISSTGNLNAKQ